MADQVYINPPLVAGVGVSICDLSIDLRSRWQDENWAVSAVSSDAAGNTNAASELVNALQVVSNTADGAIENLAGALESASEALHTCAVSLSNTDQIIAEDLREK